MSDLKRTRSRSFGASIQEIDDGGALQKNKNWYVAIVQTNCEKKVCEFLAKDGIEVFLPIQHETHIRQGKKLTVERVLLRSKVFVHIPSDSKSRTDIKKTLYVKRFLTYPGSSIDAIVPDSQMQKFKYMLCCADDEVTMATDDIIVGKHVRVARGKFVGLEGHICEMPSRKGTLVGIQLDLLGVACVKIDVSDLESI